MQHFLLSIFIFIFCNSLSAQKIWGKIITEKGDELPYSSILIKGTTRGTSANEKANYAINVSPGTYTLICQRVGYSTVEKKIQVGNQDVHQDFVLTEQKLDLQEVVVSNKAEDPAYAIIRKAIKARTTNGKGFDSLKLDLYTKDVIKLRSVPKSFFGQKIKDEEKKEMGVDSAGKGVLYLSENISELRLQKPDKYKATIKSSRVSGSNGFGFSFPVFISLYQNNVTVISSQINPRGFISPIADGALNYYKYKFLGTYYEDGKEINSIRVTPKRKMEPLFSGVINIMEDSWRIYSTDLVLTKEQQLELIDTLKITQQYVQVQDEKWLINNQHICFAAKFFGFDALGNFVSVYSNYQPNPMFDKTTFDKTLMVYEKGANQRKPEFWDSIRPMPLEVDEAKDYRVKDSSFRADSARQNSQAYLDSLNKASNKFKPLRIFWGGGYTHRHRTVNGGGYEYRIKPLIPNLEYNTVEGLVLNASVAYLKRFKDSKSTLEIEPFLRYGFSGEQLYAWANMRYTSRTKGSSSERSVWSFSGGKRISEFNKNSQLMPFVNALSTLLYGKNYMKLYENIYGLANYGKVFESGLRLNVNALFEDRKPLNNTTDFVLDKSKKENLTPNFPIEKIANQFAPHQALIVSINATYQPGQRFIQYPENKVRIGSNKPVFSASYTKGLHNILGSDVDFDRWTLGMSHYKNFKIAGKTDYRLGLGGFLNKKAVPIQDYQHFNGNQTLLASDYLNSFQLAPYYANSTTEKLYAIGHMEHHFNGFITNKIPLFNRLKWNLVGAANAFYVNKNNNYVEVSAGLENIFKMLRADIVYGFINGRKGDVGVRIGFGGIIGGAVSSNASNTRLRGNYSGR